MLGKSLDRTPTSIRKIETKALAGVRDGEVQYEAALTGLKPATRYAYSFRVGSKTIKGSLSTQPKPGAKGDFDFWVLGDSGRIGRPQKAVFEGFQKWQKSKSVQLTGMLHLERSLFGLAVKGDSNCSLGINPVQEDVLH